MGLWLLIVSSKRKWLTESSQLTISEMGDKKCERTIFAKVVKAVKEVCGLGYHPDKTFVTKIVKFLTSQVSDLGEINPILKDTVTTETQVNYLKAVFLKVVLDIESLRSLHLYPPEGCPFERWICVFSPCSDTLRSNNYKTIDFIRRKLGHEDNLPLEYFDQFEIFWNDKYYPRRSLKRKNSSTPTSPLLLFPIQALPSKTKEEIVSNFPKLGRQIDEFFICCDHFQTKVRASNDVVLEAPLALRSATIFNYSLEYLNQMLDEGLVVLKFGSRGSNALNNFSVLSSMCDRSTPVRLPSVFELEKAMSLPHLQQIGKEVSAPLDLGFEPPTRMLDEPPTRMLDELEEFLGG